MARDKDTVIDEELDREQKQRWGLKRHRRRQEEEAAPWDDRQPGGDGGVSPREADAQQQGEEEQPEPAQPKKPSKFVEFMGGMLSGSILSKAEVRKQYPYMLFVAVLMMFYIGNIFRMQSLYRRHEALTGEVKELRSKSVTLAANLAETTRQSAIIEELKRRGIDLQESVVPPKVISK